MADDPPASTTQDPDWAGEGETIYKDGQAYVVKNGQPVPQVNVGADLAKGALPALYQGFAAVKSAPASLADLAATGVDKLAKSSAALPYIPQGTANVVSNAAEGVSSWLNQPPSQTPFYQPATYNATMADAIKQDPALGYQAQTEPGKIEQSILRGAPAIAMTGGEAALPTISRAIGSGLGGWAGGYFSGGNPWGEMAGALIGYGGAPTGLPPATTERAAMADTLSGKGIPVSAAERTGSRVRATLEGQSPGDRSEQITNQMLAEGGIVRLPGNTDPISTLVNNRGQALKTQANDLTANTTLPVPPNSQLWNDLGNLDLQHTASGTGASTGNPTSLIDPKVHQAYEDFNNLASGTHALTGKQYRDLSEQWGDSDNYTIRQMGTMLDNEMVKANPQWEKWNEDWANYKGLKAASDNAGGESLKGLDPSVVRKTIMKPTGLKALAEAAEGITGSYPEPYSTAPLDSMAAILGLGYGASHGGLTGAAEGFLPGGLGAVTAALKLAQPLARSRVGQKYLMMDPKSAAAALYGQAPGGATQPNGPE